MLTNFCIGWTRFDPTRQKVLHMKLLVVDDHPLLREGLSGLLKQTEPGSIILEAADAAQALALAAKAPDLDLAILDLQIPGMDGLKVLAAFGQEHPHLPVLILSSSENPADAREALRRGALGYVPKSANPQTLLTAIRLVLDGEVYVPPLVLEPAAAPPPAPLPARAVLTARQVEILRRLEAGDSNLAIAHKYGLSEKTVKAHVTAIFRNLNVTNRTQAVSAGRAAGLL